MTLYKISCNIKIDQSNFKIQLKEKGVSGVLFFFFNSDIVNARLNSHYEAWSYKKKKYKKITAYRKSI